MKYLLLTTLFLSQATHATLLQCHVERDNYSVIMDLNLDELTINRMTYLKGEKAYKEFTDLKMEKFLLPRCPVTYDVMFNEGSFYMDIEVQDSGEITGRYIPKSSLFSFEEEFKCIKIDH